MRTLNTSSFVIILIVEVFLGKTFSSTTAGVGTAGRITPGYARYVFWVMFSISFLNYLDRNVLTGAANVVAKELGFQLDGLHFKQSMAGQDLSQALLITCTPALAIAGLVGLFGARWMKGDIAAAERTD